MNLYHLKYFVDAAREGGISPSARANRVTQSAVSRAIASLEEGLSVQLVAHERNRFQLTEAGAEVLKASQEVFDAVSRLKDAAHLHTRTLRGPLRFGCNPAIASRLIAPALAQVEARYPEIRPELKLGNTDQIQRMIDEREVDFGIVVDDGEVPKRYRAKNLLSDRLVVVRSPADRERDPAENFIVSRTHKGGLSEKYLHEHGKAYGKKITPKLVVSNWEVIAGLAAAGYGSALVPRFVCEEAIRAGKLETVFPKTKPVSFALCAIVSRNRTFPKNAQPLLDALRR